MTDEHPNIAVLKRFDPTDPAGSADVFAEDAVFHYFNPLLPELQGDYVGRDGIQQFFAKIAGATKGTFRVNPISTTAIGDELLVTHTRNTMTFPDRQVETDVVVVWRIVDGRIAEVWDIPSVYAGASETAVR